MRILNKTISTIIIFVLATSMIFAAGPQGIHEPGTGIEEPEIKAAGQETGQGLINTTITKAPRTVIPQALKAKNSTELKNIIQARQQEMDQKLIGLDKKNQSIYKNQNKVRLAVHSFLAMEDLVGGIGPQVREVAKEFNNSIQATIKAEEKIQSKGSFARFFTGGDSETAEELETEVTKNQARIKEMKQLHEECDCDEEIKAMMQENIQNMEQEQVRLQQLAQDEKKSKGIFGWIWK